MLENLKSKEGGRGKGKNRLLSPSPKVKKYVTELLHAFASRKVSFAELTQLDPKKVKQVAEMGFVKLKNGRYEEAGRIFEVLTFVDHRNPFHHLALAGTYQKQKHNVDALFQYTEALKIDKSNINALVNRGELYLREKNYKKAAEDLRAAILLDKTGKSRYSNRARSLVIALKRQLALEKEMKNFRGQIPGPKRVGPLQMIKPMKKK